MSQIRLAMLTVSAVLLAVQTTPVAAEPAASRPEGTGPVPQQSPTLRELAEPHDLPIGSAVSVPALRNDTVYRETMSQQFSSLTAENAMKWKFLEPEQGAYDWSDADELVEFAEQHGQQVYGHALVWHNGTPGWLEAAVDAGEVGPDELRGLLADHIDTLVGRYGTRVWAWDVVNEVLAEDGTLRDSLYLRELGPDYIADAFRQAHAANPEAKLFISDYNIEWIGTKSNALYNLVRDLLDEGVPIHGVGFQTHRQNPLPNNYQDNLQRFADLGLDVVVSEMDNRLELPATPDKLAVQADTYRRAMEACLRVDRCVSFSVWGFTDKYSWIPGTFPGFGAGHLYDEDIEPKPAYHAVQDALTAGSTHTPVPFLTTYTPVPLSPFMVPRDRTWQ